MLGQQKITPELEPITYETLNYLVTRDTGAVFSTQTSSVLQAAAFCAATACIRRKMWKKLFKPGGSDSENTLTTLINETGAPKELAEKVLRECNGDLALARQKLRGHNSSMAAAKDEKVPTSSSSYADAPPPYSEAVEEAMASPTPLPPPYITQEKDTLLGELKAVFPDHADERCCACFDPILPDKSEGFSGEMIWQGLKVTYAVLNNNNRHTQAVNTMLLIPF